MNFKKKTSYYKSFITINKCVNCMYAAMPLRVGFCVCVCRWCPSYWVTWGWTRWGPALTGGPSVCIPAPKTVTKATSINMSTCGNKTILSDPMKHGICSIVVYQEGNEHFWFIVQKLQKQIFMINKLWDIVGYPKCLKLDRVKINPDIVYNDEEMHFYTVISIEIICVCQ